LKAFPASQDRAPIRSVRRPNPKQEWREIGFPPDSFKSLGSESGGSFLQIFPQPAAAVNCDDPAAMSSMTPARFTAHGAVWLNVWLDDIDNQTAHRSRVDNISRPVPLGLFVLPLVITYWFARADFTTEFSLFYSALRRGETVPWLMAIGPYLLFQLVRSVVWAWKTTRKP
jgi:hypothetical protein